MSFTPDLLSTQEALAIVLSSSTPPLPPQESLLGDTTVSWWETAPGEVYVHAEGGTTDDRHYASTLTAIQLEGHGYRRAQFSLDPPSTRTAAWSDLMAKAKRLIQSGQVNLLRNGFNYIVGHVVGDHGDYDTEISRDDPNSRAITSWQCSCPWDQYAWQRTRKWKKFEGRPCAHVLALYWKALSTPMDEDMSPEQAEAMGTGQKLPAPPVPEHPPEIQKDIQQGEKHQDHLPRSFGPEGDIIQGDQQQLGLPPDATGRPGPAQAPMAPPPGGGGGPTPPGILPPFPGAGMEQPWAGPGTTPGGGVSPPGAYTVPGAKPQTPANPIQNPSTYSAVKSELRSIMDRDCDYGDIWVDETAKKVYLNIGDAFGDLIDLARAAAEKEYPGFEVEILDEGARPPNTKVAADFNAPEVVKLKNAVMGLAEGPVKGQYGDGEYREVPAGSPAEVRYQDPSTGWVEVAIALDDSGPNEPFHVTCFLEPSELEKTDQTNAFIRRHTRMAASG